LFLRQELQNNQIGRDLVVSLSSDIIRAGLACSQRARSRLPLLWEWHGKPYLGAAHGVVGILQTLLSIQPNELESVNQNLNVSVRDLIRQTIDRLDELCFPSGNLQSSLGSPRDKLVHWCHGAPGYVMLLTKASGVFQDSAYLERAKTIGDNVLMQRGLLRKGVGLCHGISGNAYALLSIGRATHDPIWIERAKLFAHFALDHFQELEMVPDRPYSLFEGGCALAALLLDLCIPEESAFPLYELI
jgi:lantibiotic modifying enzyme